MLEERSDAQNRKGGTMETMMEKMESPAVGQSMGTMTLRETCTHRRMIDDVRTRGGRRTGNVRCLECLEVIDDPHPGIE